MAEVVPSVSAGPLVFHIGAGLELVAFTTKTYNLAVIPLLESPPVPNTPPIEVSASFSFLTFLDLIARSHLKSVGTATNLSLAPFRQLITQVLPFGTPIIHDAFFASQLMSPGDIRRFSAGYQAVAPAAVPSWKTFLLFQRLQLDIKLRESIVGSIDGVRNTFELYGEIRCAATVNYLPDVTISLPWLATVKNVATHYCVKTIDNGSLVFSPPTGISQLLLWRSVVDRPTPPVDGCYAIREAEDGLHFALTVNVHPPVKNISAQLPFPGRGAMTKHSFQSPGGQLKMSKKEATVAWTAKLGENGSLTLLGVLNFENPTAPGAERCRAYVGFKSKKRSFSGLTLEKEAVALNPSGSVNLTTDMSYAAESRRYIFWGTPMAPE
jgi:AP-5 complex subunit mu-1